MGNLIDAITGSDQAHAAQEGAELQYQGTMAGVREQRRARGQMRADLRPFAKFGQGQLPQLNALINDPTAQLNFIQNNPFFKHLADDAQNRLMSVQAASGKLGSGDTAAGLQNSLLMLGNDLLQQSIGNRFNAVGMGQNSAAMTGQAGMNAANSISDLYGSGAAAQAAGLMGAANARAQGANNIIGLGMNGLMLSDRRFKTDVEVIGTLDCGIPVCRWRYPWSNQYVIGPMAQDVQKVVPGAVIDVFGVLYVDFNELNRVLH